MRNPSPERVPTSLHYNPKTWFRDRCGKCGFFKAGEHTCPESRPRCKNDGHFWTETHKCPVVLPICANGHLKSEEWSYYKDRPGICRRCQREKRSDVHRMGPRCVRGHIKTAFSWRWNKHSWFCQTCRDVRKERIRAEKAAANSPQVTVISRSDIAA